MKKKLRLKIQFQLVVLRSEFILAFIGSNTNRLFAEQVGSAANIKKTRAETTNRKKRNKQAERMTSR
jgi:hypothetical protein